jgi:peptidoglycan LD-endopeptidase LytH
MKLPKNISWKSTAVLYFAFLSVGLLAILIATFFSLQQRRENATPTSTILPATNFVLLETQTVISTATISTPIKISPTPIVTSTSRLPATSTTNITLTQILATSTNILSSTADVIAVTTTTPVTKTTTPNIAITSTTVSNSNQISNTTNYIYVFPVQANKIDYGPYHHDYPAADIFCPIGSKFVAPTSGIVDFVSREDLWAPSTDDPAVRGGLSVAIIGGDGWRYYGSHLDAIAEDIEPGVRVSAGQLLGLTGRSGNARSTPPHLHFGISQPTTADDWIVRRGQIPPFKFLQAWSRGEMTTPHP